MTISEELNKLINSKEAIRQSIIAKGTDVGTDVPFSDYASKIDEIQTGSGGGSSYLNPDFFEIRTNGGTDCSRLFANSAHTTLDLSNMDVSKAVTMDQMFSNCASLSSLDLSGWNVSNVANMRMLIYRCSKLNSLDLSSWNTDSLNDMYQMFYGCSSLTSLNMAGWDTSNVTNMSYILYGCSSLTSLDLTGWTTSNATDINCIFYNCSKLTSLDLSSWDTSNLTKLEYIFDGCSSLTSLNVVGWNTSNVTALTRTFYGCSSLTSLDLTGWNTSNVTMMAGVGSTIDSCKNLKTVKGNIDCSKVNGLSYSSSGYLFKNCPALEEVYLTNIYKETSITNNNKYSINLKDTKIKDECLVSIINELPDLINDKGLTATDKIILTLPPTNTLTAEQVQVAINKGWNVANTTY